MNKKIKYAAPAVVASFAVHYNMEVMTGGFPGSVVSNTLHKLYSAFDTMSFTDLLVALAVYLLLNQVGAAKKKVDGGAVIFSLCMSMLFLVASSFYKYNSAVVLLGSGYQILLSGICLAGFSTIIYGLIMAAELWMDQPKESQQKGAAEGFFRRHFLAFAFGVIFLGWLPWILVNYPGSGCPDSVLQLQQFFGDQALSNSHPPLSTWIMGSCLRLGSFLVDANLGFFLYCLLQTLLGAWVFALSMKKLLDLQIPLAGCVVGVIFFAFTPLWGTYAQWFEKDLLYTEAVLLQTICLMQILVKKECSVKDTVFLTLSSLLAVFLRNNGIYAVLPALLCLMIRKKGTDKKRIALALFTTFLIYEGTVHIVFPVTGVYGTSISEALSIPFQQTARYVCEHPEDITQQEHQLIEELFGFDRMSGYDPVISDPIKVYYNGTKLGEYFGMWFHMFFKHPGSYVAAFLNISYGYLAPVEANIEAWLQTNYYEYMTGIGLQHVFGDQGVTAFSLWWNVSMKLPFLNYLSMPGFYTWIVAGLAFLLARKRKMEALILLVPSFVNLLVCLASPLANSLRYELPTVASVPLLIGWSYFFLKNRKNL